MAENQIPRNPPKPGADLGASADPDLANQAKRQTEESTRAAERVVEKTAETTQEAVRAQGVILQRNIAAAQTALHSSMETGAQSVQTFTSALSRALGVTTPSPEVAEQSAQNVRAVSQASTALARGAQEASRAWLDLVQNGMRTNLEAISELGQCRSYQEVFALQSRLARQNLEQMIDQGQVIAQASIQAMRDANQAIRTT